ncbi:MAG: L,D-transpeptidase family protein [Thermomicrobiales bacterium]|nr:L,D-transpeptidase family protein [Thermomicrobiales bacterium]
MSTRRATARLIASSSLPRRRLLSLTAAAASGLALSRFPGAIAAQDASEIGSPPIVPHDATAPGDPAIQPVGVTSPGAGSRYFAETGHNLAEPFRSRWEQAGGEDVLGAPLSEERYASGAGGVLQSFRNMVLLYDPSQAPPFDVRGEVLGKSVWAELSPAAARQPVAGCPTPACQFFPETSHTLQEPFASFWSSMGGAAIFGPPVSEAFPDPDNAGQLAQVFENAVLQSDNGVVSLRPMGEALAEQQGLLDADPAFLPAPPTGGTSYLVQASDGLRLRGAPSSEASMVALLPNNTEFIASADSTADWAPGYANGLSGWVASGYLSVRASLPQLQVADWTLDTWQGATLEETNVRSEPSTASKILQTLDYGASVSVSQWLKGEEVFEGADMWAKIGDGRFVYSRNVGRNAPVLPTPLPADAPTWGQWLDVNLTQQLMTVYDGTNPLRTIVVTTGMAGWETPPGYYTILSRVANETMTSGAIGAESFYRLDDVLFTQYFTDYGHALHFAWWRTRETIGRPGSHGCINMLLDDSRYIWDWATIGTPVLIHY